MSRCECVIPHEYQLYLVFSVEQGSFFTCLLTTGGNVQCFGSNAYGQTGIGTATQSVTAPGTVVLTGVAALSAGYSHVCALMTSSGVRCWGNNDYGQLGNGNFQTVTTPPPSDLMVDVAQISTYATHSCVLMVTTGGMRCFGYNGVS